MCVACSPYPSGLYGPSSESAGAKDELAFALLGDSEVNLLLLGLVFLLQLFVLLLLLLEPLDTFLKVFFANLLSHQALVKRSVDATWDVLLRRGAH